MGTVQPAKVLTIAGSDSGGAAGLQADLKTFTALGAYGMSAVTVVTAQNSIGVAALHSVPPAIVAAQIDAVLRDYGAAAVKTGFLGNVALVEGVAASLQPYRSSRALPLVVDPVLVNHRGEAMFVPDVAAAYAASLMPGCTLLTPNRREAALLCGRGVDSWAEVAAAARRLCQMGAQSVLITGVRQADRFGDAFCDGPDVHFLETEPIQTANTHGSGDTLSAAVAVFLANDLPLFEAVQRARAFTASAIRGAAHWHMGAGHGPLDHLQPRAPN